MSGPGHWRPAPTLVSEDVAPDAYPFTSSSSEGVHSPSLWLQIQFRVLDHLAPLAISACRNASKAAGVLPTGSIICSRKILLESVLCLRNFAIEPSDHGRRRAGGDDNTNPCTGVERREARLNHCRNVRQRGRAMLGGDRERLELAVRNVGQKCCWRRNSEPNLFAQQRCQEGRAATIRDVRMFTPATSLNCSVARCPMFLRSASRSSALPAFLSPYARYPRGCLPRSLGSS